MDGKNIIDVNVPNFVAITIMLVGGVLVASMLAKWGMAARAPAAA